MDGWDHRALMNGLVGGTLALGFFGSLILRSHIKDQLTQAESKPMLNLSELKNMPHNLKELYLVKVRSADNRSYNY